MPVRSRAMVPSTASRVLIRVEDYAHKQMKGLMYNPYMDVSMRFNDVVDFTARLDQMFDELSFPQAAMSYRSFDAGRKEPAKDKGKVAGQTVAKREQLNGHEQDVFIVHVQFRQNATWQGTIKWAGQNEEKRFRSTLEMLKIMDSALSAKQEPEPEGPEEAEE